MLALRTLGCMAYAVLVAFLCYLALTGDYTPDSTPPAPRSNIAPLPRTDDDAGEISLLSGTTCTPITAKNGCRYP